MRQPNEPLKRLIEEASWSYRELARAVRRVASESGVSLRTNSAAVAHWVAGTRPTRQTAECIAEALTRRLGRSVGIEDVSPANDQHGGPADVGTTDGNPIDLLCRLGRGDIGRRRLFTSAVYSVAAAALPIGVLAEHAASTDRARSGGRAGPADIAAVQDMAAAYTAIDERHGGQHGRSAVVEYLTTDVAALCRATWATEDQHQRMLSAAVIVAYLCGWKAYDAGEHGLAQQYYLQAYRLAIEADDPVQAAFCLRIMAHNGIDLERPEYTVQLAERAAALVAGRVDPATRALYHITTARALAYAHRPRATVDAAIDAAWQELEGSDDDARPLHVGLWGPTYATVSSHTAKTHGLLRDLSAAERGYDRAARTYGARGRVRIAGLSQISTGKVQADQGRVEQACQTWQTGFDLLDGVQSARVADAISDIRSRIGHPRLARLATVRELRERLDATEVERT